MDTEYKLELEQRDLEPSVNRPQKVPHAVPPQALLPDGLLLPPASDFRTVVAALTEQIYVRDVLLLIATVNNSYDRDIAQRLIKSDKLEPGQWQHFFDEMPKFDLPEAHLRSLARIHRRLTKPPPEVGATGKSTGPGGSAP